LVSSGFVRGEGQLLVRLRPEVLGGSEVQLVAKAGTLMVVIHPATQEVSMIVEANRTQFEQYLAEKVYSWRVSVAVKRGEDDERL
jgi:flagellar hook-length control protein FliK